MAGVLSAGQAIVLFNIWSHYFMINHGNFLFFSQTGVCVCVFGFVFEKGFHYVALPGLELTL